MPKAVWLSAKYVLSLSLSFVICIMEIMKLFIYKLEIYTSLTENAQKVAIIFAHSWSWLGGEAPD